MTGQYCIENEGGSERLKTSYVLYSVDFCFFNFTVEYKSAKLKYTKHHHREKLFETGALWKHI